MMRRCFSKKSYLFRNAFRAELNIPNSHRVAAYLAQVHGLAPLITQSSKLQQSFRMAYPSPDHPKVQQYFEAWTGLSQKKKMQRLSTPLLTDEPSRSISLHKKQKRKLVESKPVLDLFANYLREKHQPTIESVNELQDFADLSNPQNWYPEARKIPRKVYFHLGPTNSGKTRAALERLKQAKTGIYCAPLRLLAWEVCERMIDSGVKCNLTTGQQSKVDLMARHLACTVEMADLRSDYEVAVIDQIQMIADPQRGNAWTSALLGLRAKQIHICGEPRALPLIKRLCEQFGDDVQCSDYQRLSQLKVASKPFRNLSWLQAGDCVVAFQVHLLISLKRQINNHFNKLNSTEGENYCAIIYGQLPSEVKKTQAQRYNEGELKFLLATDAIGMGMNLSIQRVIFWTTQRHTSNGPAPLDISQIRQIAGRAGRYRKKGIATAFTKRDLDRIRSAINGPPLDALEQACLFPPYSLLQKFAEQLYLRGFSGPQAGITEILSRFKQLSALDANYFMKKSESYERVGELLQQVPGLSLRVQYIMIFAPISSRGLRQDNYVHQVLQYIKSVGAEQLVGLPGPVGSSDLFQESQIDLLTSAHSCKDG